MRQTSFAFIPYWLFLLGCCRSVIKEAVLQSRQMGRRENKSINIEGRCQFDLLLVSGKEKGKWGKEKGMLYKKEEEDGKV